MTRSANWQAALNILGVQNDSINENIGDYIRRKYHEKALELHPDKNGDTESFQELLSAYELISRAIRENESDFYHYLEKRTRNSSRTENLQPEDFQLYKKAVRDYSVALQEYFDRAKQVNLDPDDPDYRKLCDRVRTVKKDLFNVVRLNPGGIWTSDCLDKINKINIWLKNENYTSK